MGKDFTSTRGDDNVFTPYSMTEQLLENEKFDYNKTVLEPACGEMAIVKILEKRFTAFKQCYDLKFQKDFLLQDDNNQFNYIITNPPYSVLDKFIIKAKTIATEKFAFLCKLTHLGGVERFTTGIFKDENYPLTKIYLFTRQSNLRFFDKNKELKILEDKFDGHNENDNKIIRQIEILKKQIDYPYLREDGCYPAGMYYYCWLIWEKRPIIRFCDPCLKWIDNNKYILRKSVDSID